MQGCTSSNTIYQSYHTRPAPVAVNHVELCYAITDQLQLRVADSALSDDLFPEDYHALPPSKSSADAASTMRPIAWMALEAITEGVTSQPADVWSWGVLAWELSTLAQQPYQDLAMTLLPDYLRDGYRLAQPATCPDVLYQLMAFCWAINPQHRPRAALLVEYLLGLTQQPFSSLNQTLVPTVHDFQLANHIPASSFLHNSASVGADLKRLNQGYHSTLMNTSASVTGDVKGFPQQFHSHSLNPSSSCAISKSDLKGLSQLAPHYSQPASLMANGGSTTEEEDAEADGNDVSGGDVYSTPSTSEADMQPWRFNSQRPPNGAVSVPPPLPPANGSLPSVRAPRPQQPLPNLSNTIVL
ncbi:Serine-threonine/tyrosine-protein kinase catalytic domain [Trinorchestia longiramus]|nr:Serine-threonine/tyrosine-protein kinase catalytic domain [Trinorchestia longiramus]